LGEDLADVGVGGFESEGLFVGLDGGVELAVEVVGDTEVGGDRGVLGTAGGGLLIGGDRGWVLFEIQMRFADVTVGPGDGFMLGIKLNRGGEGGDRVGVLEGVEVGDAEGVGVIEAGMELLGLLEGLGGGFEFAALGELLAALEALLGLLDGGGGLGGGGKGGEQQQGDGQGDDRGGSPVGNGEGHGMLRIDSLSIPA
jgi:hypothetical protein